ncbi:MAG: hypothetical protein AAF085_07855 [Planctomycetota bacterium]
MTLIFGYGLFQAVVPPTIFGTQTPDAAIATSPETQPSIEFVTQNRENDQVTTASPTKLN